MKQNLLALCTIIFLNDCEGIRVGLQPQHPMQQRCSKV